MKREFVKIVALLVILVLALNTIVMAATQSELQNEKKQTNEKINDTKEELQGVQAEKSATQKQVEELNNQISGYQNEINELDGKIDELSGKITEAEANLQKAQEDYTKQEELLKERLVATYEAGQTSYLDVILSSKSLTDFISNYYLVTQIADNDKALMNKIQDQKKEIETTKQELETNKNEVATSKESKEAKQGQLEVAKKEKDIYVAQLSESEKDLQKEIEELQAHESSISNKIKKMQEEYDRQMAAKRSSGGSKSPSGATSSFGFGWPVANNSIGTGYGVPGRMWSLGYHTGVDFPVGVGTPVYAVGDGQVVDTGYNRAYGNFVEIYHGNNVYSFYAHASSVIVGHGASVSKGQQIMLSGATGNITGPHLHFEIRTPGSGFSSCVNPMSYLP